MRRVLVLLGIIVATATAIFAYELDFNYFGATEKGRRNGYILYEKKDGTIIKKYPEREEAVQPDGTRIIKRSNGTRTIHAADGTRIEIAMDGTTTYTYENGETHTISMDGRTPYGLEIEPEIRRFRKRDLVVELYYSPEKSDDMLKGYKKSDSSVEDYYNELDRYIQWWLYNKDVPKRGKMRIEISNCRYARTGFCAREKRQDIVVIRQYDSKTEKVTVAHSDLQSKEGPERQAKRTVEHLMSVN